jgi:NAD(P)-dependent dehydrogenase (short-subunit alcohol dehydrogenase family)
VSREVRTILVTGGASGIGLATGEVLASGGAHVILVDRDGAAAERQAARLAGEGLAVEGAVADVTDPSAVGHLVDDVSRRVGMDGLVNAAGLLQLGTISDVSEQDWDRIVDVNLKGTYVTCRAVIPVLEALGGGAIVNLASIAGRTKSYFSAPNYVASKAGVIGLTMVLAAQHAASGIRVNCVAPGVFRTPMTSVYTDEQWASILATIPMGRIGEASEVAHVIATLLSDEWGYVTGQTINVNGGQFML